MSQILRVYLADFDELEAVIGSGNEELLNRILDGGSPWRRTLARLIPPLGRRVQHAPRLSTSWHLSDQAGHVERNKSALRTIFAGGPYEKSHAANYVEAMELICRQLGPTIGDVAYRGSTDDLPDLIDQLATSMMWEPPFPATDGYSGWGVSGKEYAAEELECWEDEVAEDPDCANGYGAPVVEWLRASIAANKDLIGFW
ncbi:DUF7691 family protein [Nocardia niigatensis]